MLKIKDVRDKNVSGKHGKALYEIYGMNSCCRNKPFLLIDNSTANGWGYACECKCGGDCTGAYEDMIRPVIEYLNFKLIADFEKDKDKWISVYDKLPRTDDDGSSDIVLIAILNEDHVNYSYASGYYDSKEMDWVTDFCDDEGHDVIRMWERVTHWKPLKGV